MEELIFSNAVAKAFGDALFFHAFFAIFTILPIVINLYTLFVVKDPAKIVKKMWFVMPLLFFIVVVDLFTGGFLFMMMIPNGLANISFSLMLMVVLALFMLIGEIIRIRQLKTARRTSLDAFLAYVKFCKVLYLLEFALFATIYIIYFC